MTLCLSCCRRAMGSLLTIASLPSLFLLLRCAVVPPDPRRRCLYLPRWKVSWISTRRPLPTPPPPRGPRPSSRTCPRRRGSAGRRAQCPHPAPRTPSRSGSCRHGSAWKRCCCWGQGVGVGGRWASMRRRTRLVRARALPPHSTTVYKVQEAFNNVTLPDENVYKTAIENALGLTA
jgi:hypothetical protein